MALSTKVSFGDVIVYVLLFLAILIPGYLFIFLFGPHYFFKLDLFRLTVISLSISIPIITINIAHFVNVYQTKDGDYNLVNAIFRAEIASVLVLYLPNIVGYFMNFNLVYGVLALLLTQVFVSVILIFTRIREA